MRYLTQIITLIALVTVSCSHTKKPVSNSKDSVLLASGKSLTWIVDPKASLINWKGTKPTGSHEGTITIAEGFLSTENNLITSGNFTIDMSTITETTNSDKPEGQAKLIAHLKSPDFFNIDSFPTSTFSITKIEGHKIYGNLLIKNITREVMFDAITKIEDATLTATSEFDINRTDWGVNYNSGKFIKDKIANKVIRDRINYRVKLVAYKK